MLTYELRESVAWIGLVQTGPEAEARLAEFLEGRAARLDRPQEG